MSTTTGGWLLVLALTLPALGVLLALALGGKRIAWIVAAVFPTGLAVAVAISAWLWRGGPLVYVVGNWQPPLGIVLRADAVSAAMLTVTAVVICAVVLFAAWEFHQPSDAPELRTPLSFWALLLAIWCALNVIAVGGDLFTLYVALELLTFAAVPIVCLTGAPGTLRAALRYLLFALAGSVLYLLGTALVYGGYGALDIALLSTRVRPEPVALVAAALMTSGLLAKTALFPLHFWLPPAHAGAPAAGSAILSSLVVKGSFFIVVRLWFDAMPALMTRSAANLLGGLGTAAIVFGSIMALRQQRLKLMIAYSTLAQIGFLFIIFPVALRLGAPGIQNDHALAAGMLQLLSHATAKAAMFMAAGLIYLALGNDLIAELGQIWRLLPGTVLALILAGLALIGLPPSGAYVAKKLLLQAASESGQAWWTTTIEAGGIFTSSYLILLIAHLLAPARRQSALCTRSPKYSAMPAVGLALCSWALGLAAWGTFHLPDTIPSVREIITELTNSFSTVLAGAGLAVLIGVWHFKPAPNWSPPGRTLLVRALTMGANFAHAMERFDFRARSWQIAGSLLLITSTIFAIALFVQ